MIKNTYLHRLSVPFTSMFNKLPLRYILVVPFVLQIVAVGGVIGFLSFRSGKEAVSRLSDQLRSEITNRVEDRLRTYLSVPPIVNQINMNAIQSGLLDLQDEGSVEKYLFSQLNAFPLITFSHWGEESKRYFCAIRRRDGTSQILRMGKPTGENLNFYATDRLGNRTALLRSVHIGNLLNRPWYRAAREAGKPTWTKIYASTASRDLSITAVSPVYDTSGNLRGVLGTAFQFLHLNNFLRRLQISPHGLVFLMEDSGELITTSTDETGFIIRDGKAIRIKATESRNKVIRTAGKYLQEHFGDLSRQGHGIRQSYFDIDGERHLLQVAFPELHENIHFLIVTVVPEADFMAQIQENTRMTILLCLLALVMATGIGLLTARWVTGPIASLSTSAKKIAKGRWNETIRIRRSDELGELATSFNSMANQLRLGLETLEQRVEERTAELTEANTQLKIAKRKAEAANKAKSEFLANMNHELRTPLNTILGFAQIMARNPGLSAKEQEHLGIIQRGGEHLLALINQVLDLSKIEAGRMTLNETNFNLCRLLDDLNDMFSLKARKKGVQLLSERADNVPPRVRTDEVKLRQVLINLLNNAVKFTQEGGVALHVRRAENGGNGDSSPHGSIATLQFSVSDTGPGIAPDEAEILFDTFVQTATGRQIREGTGLGLAISRKFVRMMGGISSSQVRSDGAQRLRSIFRAGLRRRMRASANRRRGR